MRVGDDVGLGEVECVHESGDDAIGGGFEGGVRLAAAGCFAHVDEVDGVDTGLAGAERRCFRASLRWSRRVRWMSNIIGQPLPAWR